MTMRWGLIGASDIAATRLIPAIRAHGDEVVAVQSGTAEWAAQFARSHGISQSTTAVDELCRGDLDAVYVSSTNEKHRSQVAIATAAGKHVLCEKPMALTIEDARSMTEGAQRAGVVLAVNHHLPGAATHRAMQRLVRNGAIGVPLAVRVSHAVTLPARLRGWRLADVAGGGVIMDITCHDASAVNALLGTLPLEATALAVRQGQWGDDPDAGRPGSPDAVMATLRYEGNVLVHTHAAFTVGHVPTRLEVLGTEGAILAHDVMTQDPCGTVHLRTASGEHEVELLSRPDLYSVVLHEFAEAVAGHGVPSVTAAAGLMALSVALAVQESAANGRSVAIDAYP
jgi:1,5-anhydro-D-fructose reductase (1,5-anhydro-D-mannitol-forming)